MELGVFQPIEKLKHKSDAESCKYRAEGNTYYSKKRHFEAIVLFNKAIAHAKSEKCLALSYGNRSAAFFEAKKYQECIESIKLARENDYPAEKIEKLDEREKKCIQMLATQASIKKDPADDPWEFFKLSYPAKATIPWLIDGLEMRRTEKYGRGVYTTRNLLPGDIIAIEDCSTMFTLQEGSFYKHCANCLKSKMLQLLPCIKTGEWYLIN